MRNKIWFVFALLFALLFSTMAAEAAVLPVDGSTIAIYDSPDPDEFVIGTVSGGMVTVTTYGPGGQTKVWKPIPVSPYLTKYRWVYLFIFPIAEDF